MLFCPDETACTFAETESALCVWEWMIEMPDGQGPIGELCGAYGAVAMRRAAIQVGLWVDAAYKEMERQGYGYDGAYDWDFVPDFCSRLDWEEFTEPDIPAILAAMMKDDAEQKHPNFYRAEA